MDKLFNVFIIGLILFAIGFLGSLFKSSDVILAFGMCGLLLMTFSILFYKKEVKP